MATPHLTKNKLSAGHLNAISGSGGDHLVIVQQNSSWANKQLIVTPTESKFALAYAYGKESAPSLPYSDAGAAGDAHWLASEFTGRLYSATWNDGPKALFFCYSRGGLPTSMGSPYRMADGEADFWEYSEFSGTAIALKFNLRQLDLASDATFSAYVRAYCPSLFLRDSDQMQYATAPAVFAGYTCQMEYRFFETLPGNSADVGGNDTNRMNLYGTANNGLAAGTVVSDPAIYTPYAYTGGWSANLRTAVYPGWRSTAGARYHDYEITSNYDATTHTTEAGKNFLAAGGHSEVWLVARPRISYPSPLEGYDVLFGYIQRLELVFRISKPFFNRS